jgi:hypothetical protein
VTRKPQADEGDVAASQEVPKEEPMLSRHVLRAGVCRPEGTDPEEACRPDCSGASREVGKAMSETSDLMAASFFGILESEFCDGACGACDEIMDLACLGLCIRCCDCSASRAWKSEGATTMRASEWSWHDVAIAPLETRRRMVRRSAGLLVTNPKPSGARMATATEPLIAESPALRRHQNLVKTGIAMLMRTGINREGGSMSAMPARSADGTLWVNRRSGMMHLRYSRLHDRSACGSPRMITTFCSTWRKRCVRRNVWTKAFVRSA